jgi:hypothetical protein
MGLIYPLPRLAARLLRALPVVAPDTLVALDGMTGRPVDELA